MGKDRTNVIAGSLALVSLLTWGTAASWADPTVHLDYVGVSVGFTPGASPGGGVFSVHETSASAAQVQTFNAATPSVILDRADIYNGLPGYGSFQMSFGGNLAQGGGPDNLQWSGAMFRATDALTSMAAPSLLGSFQSHAFGNDADGITFSNGVLTIAGLISNVPGNSSILGDPAGPGDWTYAGRSDAGTPGGGADGVANQITIGSRNSYSTGILALLEISLRHYADGTLITASNADALFAEASAHGGFLAVDGDVKVNINPVPAPGAVMLGVIGLGLVGRMRRRACSSVKEELGNEM